MRVVVNGLEREVPEGMTVRALIDEVVPKGQACAAEVNKELVPRREHEARGLREGDLVELVTLVGGG
jgi:sulfur carrier protein